MYTHFDNNVLHGLSQKICNRKRRNRGVGAQKGGWGSQLQFMCKERVIQVLLLKKSTVFVLSIWLANSFKLIRIFFYWAPKNWKKTKKSVFLSALPPTVWLNTFVFNFSIRWNFYFTCFWKKGELKNQNKSVTFSVLESLNCSDLCGQAFWHKQTSVQCHTVWQSVINL